MNIVSDEALEQIHDASLHILENFGIEFMAQDARDTFVRAGALADDETGRVRLGRELVDAALATCPSYFELTPRNPDRKLRLGENFMNFTLVAGPPSVHDEINGRRSGGMSDYVDLVKLAQSFDVIHAVGKPTRRPHGAASQHSAPRYLLRQSALHRFELSTPRLLAKNARWMPLI